MKRQSQNKRKITLGLTGSFGSGKTTVARIFRSYGAQVLDADKLAHGCIARGTPAYERIIHTFGKGIIKKNRIIDRNKLAEIVFNNINLLIKLNNIVHPHVLRIIKSKINSSKSNVTVIDAPLLLEAGLDKIVDKLIVVKLNLSQQIKRIQKRTALKKADILKRICSQIPLRQKVSIADFVVDNSGTIQETKKQVKDIWKKMNLSLADRK
jgi:dephospho-CoA kinase